jgi:hypothetical protein
VPFGRIIGARLGFAYLASIVIGGALRTAAKPHCKPCSCRLGKINNRETNFWHHAAIERCLKE